MVRADNQVLEEATAWLVRLDTGAASPSEVQRWRRSDPRNEAAFLAVAGAWRGLGDLGVARRSESALLGRRALFRAACIAGASVLIATGPMGHGFAEATVSTGIGERKTTRLPNGVVAQLNTDSTLGWSKDGSELRLARGEVGLDVPGGSIPVVLQSQGGAAELASGSYNARLVGSALDLCTLSGQARLRTQSSSAPVVASQERALLNGDQARMRHLTPLDLDKLEAWRRGELVFEGEPLERVVAEYNRYLEHKIIIADDAVARLRVGGRFSSTDARGFVQALGSSFGVTCTEVKGALLLTQSPAAG